MEVQEVLKAERIKRGEALRVLAQRVGVDPAYLSRVESGKAKASRALLRSLAGALELPETRLLALGGFLPDAWREAAERGMEGLPSELGVGPGAALPHPSPVPRAGEGGRLDPHPNPLPKGEGTGARAGERAASGFDDSSVVAEPAVQFASERTLARLDRLADPLAGMLPEGYLPSPEINEVYELKLALLEARLLGRQEVLERGAYVLAVDGGPTRHFRLCAGSGVQLPRDSGTRLRSFLAAHRFKTSYATHGLFPYRGKFHPQMVKALLNVMGLRPGEVVLDPMAGSGTTSVEAALSCRAGGTASVPRAAHPASVVRSQLDLATAGSCL